MSSLRPHDTSKCAAGRIDFSSGPYYRSFNILWQKLEQIVQYLCGDNSRRCRLQFLQTHTCTLPTTSCRGVLHVYLAHDFMQGSVCIINKKYSIRPMFICFRKLKYCLLIYHKLTLSNSSKVHLSSLFLLSSIINREFIISR